MISEQQFYEQVFDNFKELHDKIDGKYESLSGKIDSIKEDLCDRITNHEKIMEKHLAVEDALKQQKVTNTQKIDRKFYIIMAIMGTVTSSISLVAIFT